MKTLFICALLLGLIMPLAAADGALPVYTVTSVTDCANTGAMFDRFYGLCEPGPVVPGLKEGLVPQGIAPIPHTEQLLFCGYRADKGNSALIAVDMQTGAITRAAALKYADGRDYNGHAGGVCVTDSDIYISNASHLYRISLERFNALPETGVCRFDEEIPVPVNASFCSFQDGILWVGEFQLTGDYPTDPAHMVRTADGLQRAWICGYRVGEGEDFAAPDMILSVTERIQGMTMDADHIYLSQSYGRRASSSLLKYENVLLSEPDHTVIESGAEVPVYILDSASRLDVLIAPPMSECICRAEEGIIVLFESAAAPYTDPAKPSVNPIDRVFILKDF